MIFGLKIAKVTTLTQIENGVGRSFANVSHKLHFLFFDVWACVSDDFWGLLIGFGSKFCIGLKRILCQCTTRHPLCCCGCRRRDVGGTCRSARHLAWHGARPSIRRELCCRARCTTHPFIVIVMVVAVVVVVVAVGSSCLFLMLSSVLLLVVVWC